MSPRDLTSIFSDPEKADTLLGRLLEPQIGSYDERGNIISPDSLRSVFVEAFAKSPDPDKSILNLHRIDEVSFGTAFLRDIIRHPVLMDLIVLITSQSQYLSDILVRDPELFRWLTATDVLEKVKSKSEFQLELKNQSEIFSKTKTRMNSVRRYYRREMLRIGVRELLGDEPFGVIAGEISDLADAVSNTVYNYSYDEAVNRFQWKPDISFVIIGMGKLGGRELNYSSDIDVMFVMGNEHNTEEPVDTVGNKHAVEFFTFVADTWIALMTEYTSEGTLYRVDARLRPDGGGGPLVRSIGGYQAYYESRGELWERQMLIKARPIAGDIEFGEQFLETLQPFIYPSTFFLSPRQTIARIKARIEQKSRDINNIKLCGGGIRDIEFIVQALQLLNAGKNQDIRCRSTLESLDRLKRQSLISNDEYRILSEAYVYLRKLEHRIQLEDNIQTHSVPSGPADRLLFARKLGYRTTDELEHELNNVRTSVRRIFAEVFGDETADPIIEDLFLPESTADAGHLQSFGFRDPKRARDLMQRLANGVSYMGIGEHDVRTKEIFRKIAPLLMEDFSGAIDADRALNNFLSIVQDYPYPQAMYTSLENSAIRRGLINLCGMSDRFAARLRKYPGDFELLMNDADKVFSGVDFYKTGIEGYSERFIETAAHIRFINGKAPLDEVHQTLSYLAGKKIRYALKRAFENRGITPGGMAVLSLGKLSGGEIGPGADLDLIIFYDGRNELREGKADIIVQDIIRLCSERADDTPAFEIDLRLRPEGQSGPLAVDINIYGEYLHNRASFWERQSLVRGKVIEGDPTLKERVESLIHGYVFESDLPDSWVDGIGKMRYRTEGRSRMNRADFIDFKTGAGGIMDIEFMVQAAQLKYGRVESEMRSPSTKKCLEIMKVNGEFDTDRIQRLEYAYSIFRKAEYFNRIYMEDPSNLIPAGADELEILKKFLEIEENPVNFFRELTGLVRGGFKSLLNGLKTV